MQSFYLGADVSKGYADFVILDEQKKTVVENFQLDDTSTGHSKLFNVLGRLLDRNPQSTVFAAVESTGGYENNWVHSLRRFQSTLTVSVARLNPLGVMHNSKADLKRNTTDKISARSIAEYLIAHREKVSYRNNEQWVGLRKQWGFIKMLTKQCTQMLNQLESLLYTANPDLCKYCKDGVPNWVLKLLVKYGTAAHLSRARVSTVAKIPYISKKRASELVHTAKNSMASTTDPVTRQLVEATANQILSLKKTIEVQKARMVAMTAIRSNPLIREVYEQHLSRGKAKMDAIGVCMHKILRVIYGMLKNRTPFDPQIDKTNRQRVVGKTADPKADKSRRYQGFDPAAPISRRQNQKRLERKEPHCADDTTFGVIAPVPEPST